MASKTPTPGTWPETDLTAVEIKANMTSGGNAAFRNYASVDTFLSHYTISA